MGNLFDSKQNTASTATQSGTSNTTGNIWPQIQPFVSSFLQDATNTTVQPNQYQLTAGDQQTGVAGTLAPASGVANTVAQNGLTPDAISSYMSPYISSVVNPTLAAQNIQNEQALSALRGNQATRGALGNNTGSEAAYLAGVQPAQEATIAGLYNTGYGQAGQLAGTSAGLQLQGAQTAGTLANSATTANTGLGNIGQGIASTELSNALIPTQYASAISPLSGAAGSNTQSTGTSNGNSTTTQQPSTGGIIAGLAGAALSGFSDARVKENIKPVGKTFDGQSIYKYNFKGSPKTEIGLIAQEVEGKHPEAVGSMHGIKTVDYDKATKDAEPFASGGAVMTPFHHSDDMVTKVGKAFGALHKMRKLAEGGGGPRHFDDGGDVGLGDWGAGTTVTPSSFMDGFNVGNVGKGLTNLSNSVNAKPGQSGSDPLTPFMHDMEMRNQQFARGYDDGGSVDSPSWASRAMAPLYDAWSGIKSLGGIDPENYPVVQGYEYLKNSPEAVATGMRGMGEAALNAFPSLNAPRLAAQAGYEMMMPRHRDVGPAAAPVPAAATVSPAPDDAGTMTPFDAFKESAPDTDAPIASNEPSSIASAKEVLPWKLGGADRLPPSVTASLPPPVSGGGSSWKDYLPFQSGVWKGDQMSPAQRIGFALTQVGADNPFKGYGQYGLSLDKARLDQAQNAREQQLQPSTIQLMAAKAKEASQNADLDYQIKAATAMGDLKRVQELQRMKSMMGLANDNGINPVQAMVFDRVWNPPNSGGH